MFKKFKNLYERHEHFIGPVFFILGFLWDNLTLNRIDFWLDNLVIILYLVIAGLAITILQSHEAGRLKSRLVKKYIELVPFFIQFTFGGLFSAFFVFYSRGASPAVSWPFLLMLASLLVGNELFRKSYGRLVFQLSIYFMVIFSYSIFIVPVLLRSIDTRVFLLSGVLSLFLVLGVVYTISWIAPDRIKKGRRVLFFSIGGIYLLFNFFYFANFIPPLPLALKEGGVYHSVERREESYHVRYEPAAWYAIFNNTSSVFHWSYGDPVYVFSSIFAPTGFGLDIFHHWFYFDKQTRNWVETDRFSFAVEGGRGGGYRGYTLKSHVTPGRWRVEVTTRQGQILGRIDFEVVESFSIPKLKEEVL